MTQKLTLEVTDMERAALNVAVLEALWKRERSVKEDPDLAPVYQQRIRRLERLQEKLCDLGTKFRDLQHEQGLQMRFEAFETGNGLERSFPIRRDRRIK